MSHFPSSKVLKALLSTALASAMLLSSGLSHAQQVLRVSAIPDEAPTELQRKFKPLGDYLEKKLGVKVEFTPVTDYAASVEGLINNKLDMVWFGGFTFIQAKVRSNNQVVPLVQRAEDEKFKSVFITTSRDITKLEDLKGKTLTFGSESSTSGHLMPRSYLLAAKINPDTDMKRIAFSGASHQQHEDDEHGGNFAAGQHFHRFVHPLSEAAGTDEAHDDRTANRTFPAVGGVRHQFRRSFRQCVIQ